MSASLDHRWQAATGAIIGSLVAGSVAADTPDWTETGRRTLAHGEDLLRGRPTPIDLPVDEVVAVAVGLSRTASPLLVEAASVEFIDAVRATLDGAPPSSFVDERLARAAVIARSTASFAELIVDAGHDARLAGAVRGLEAGVGAVPARLVADIGEPDGRRGRRYVSRLVDRMLALERNDWYEARTRRGPREVLPGLWLSNIHGLASFAAEYPDGLVLSLCDIEGRLDDYPGQITFHLDDTPKAVANPQLAMVIDEVLHEVQRARSAEQPVLVHCRHGASRTGLVLRALLVEEQGFDAEAALIEAQCLWSHTSTWNAAWNREIERRAGQR